jgi:hypothetical protein
MLTRIASRTRTAAASGPPSVVLPVVGSARVQRTAASRPPATASPPWARRTMPRSTGAASRVGETAVLLAAPRAVTAFLPGHVAKKDARRLGGEMIFPAGPLCIVRSDRPLHFALKFKGRSSPPHPPVSRPPCLICAGAPAFTRVKGELLRARQLNTVDTVSWTADGGPGPEQAQFFAAWPLACSSCRISKSTLTDCTGSERLPNMSFH